MTTIRIRDMNPGVPAPSDFIAVDAGTTRKATVVQVCNVGAPIATRAEAEAGTDETKRMTPKTTADSIASHGASLFATFGQGSKADTAVQPGDLGALAGKDKAAISDLDTTGTASSLTVLHGDGGWKEISSGAELASVSEILAGTDTTKAIGVANIWQANSFAGIDSAGPDDYVFKLTDGVNFQHTLISNVPSLRLYDVGVSQTTTGNSGVILLQQDATGGRTVSFAPSMVFQGGAPSLSEAPNSIDIICYLRIAPNLFRCTFIKGS